MRKGPALIKTKEEAEMSLVVYKNHLGWKGAAKIVDEKVINGRKFWKFKIPGLGRPLILVDTNQIVEEWEVNEALVDFLSDKGA